MSQRHRVVIADFINDALEPERRILGDIADVTALDAMSEDALVGHIDDADAVMLYHNLSMRTASVDRLRRCKLIVRCGVGIDNVDHARARQRGIAVANVPDYGTEEVADTAMGMMLSLVRGISPLNMRLIEGRDPWSYTPMVPRQRLRGEVLGIVGLGRIGTAASVRAKAMGMDVAFYDPYRPDGADKSIGVRRVESLDELLEQAYVVTLHCPLTDETRGIINAGSIARMRNGSFVINTARGAIVETAAIADAVANGHLAGAGLDVLPCEPPAIDDPLIRAWRDPDHPAHLSVIINPHSAFYSEQGLLDIRTKASTACRRALLGQPVRNVIN